ncbi:MAG: hypothetical protein FJX75_25850 [Armatimonadetes bacterium]|nr:hypothetical protein [Armatimonadota bacterium]
MVTWPLAVLLEALLPMAAHADKLEARIAPTAPLRFACLSDPRSPLTIDLSWEPATIAPDGPSVRLRFREVFSGLDKVAYAAVRQTEPGKGWAQVTPGDLTLTPGLYHVRADLAGEGGARVEATPGSAEFYLAKPGESAWHVLGSFFIGRVAFTWDPDAQVYWRNTPEHLPPSLDPFDAGDFAAYRQAVTAPDPEAFFRHPELQHDGGVAFLHGAEVFRTLGEEDRATFCEEVLKRTAATVLDIMTDEQGHIRGTKRVGDQWEHDYYIRQQAGFVLKLLCQTLDHFAARDEPYARDLWQRIQPIVTCEFAQENPLGCGGSGCKVYDGRILAGLAYCCLTEKRMTGAWNDEHVARVMDFASRAADHCVQQKGWYDDGCYNEGKCHIGFGTQNILCGLLPARQIALDRGDLDTAARLKPGIETGLDFLARTNGSLTNSVQWVPTRHSQWANGNMHEILDMYRAQFGDSEPLTWYYANLFRPTLDFWVLAFHRCDILATVLLESPEYKAALQAK